MPIVSVGGAPPKAQDERRWWGPQKGEPPPRPLEVLARRIDALIEGREQCLWDGSNGIGNRALRVCDAWANLSQGDRAYLHDAGLFPNAPDVLGEWSGANWCGYLGFWFASKQHRELARAAVRAAIARGGGAGVPDPVYGAVCGAEAREPPF